MMSWHEWFQSEHSHLSESGREKAAAAAESGTPEAVAAFLPELTRLERNDQWHALNHIFSRSSPGPINEALWDAILSEPGLEEQIAFRSSSWATTFSVWLFEAMPRGGGEHEALRRMEFQTEFAREAGLWILHPKEDELCRRFLERLRQLPLLGQILLLHGTQRRDVFERLHPHVIRSLQPDLERLFEFAWTSAVRLVSFLLEKPGRLRKWFERRDFPKMRTIRVERAQDLLGSMDDPDAAEFDAETVYLTAAAARFFAGKDRTEDVELDDVLRLLEDASTKQDRMLEIFDQIRSLSLGSERLEEKLTAASEPAEKLTGALAACVDGRCTIEELVSLVEANAYHRAELLFHALVHGGRADAILVCDTPWRQLVRNVVYQIQGGNAALTDAVQELLSWLVQLQQIGATEPGGLLGDTAAGLLESPRYWLLPLASVESLFPLVCQVTTIDAELVEQARTFCRGEPPLDAGGLSRIPVK